MNIVRKLVLSLVALAAFLLCVAVPRPQAEDQDRCQRRVAHAEHELHEAIDRHGRHSSQANRTTRGSVAGVSGINSGTNTTTAGTRTAIGTSTTTTKQLWSAPFQGFAGLLAIDRHNSLTGFRRPLIRFYPARTEQY
jgi:hypothetical protein